MPPKPKLIKADIIDFAFNHVRAHGWEGLTARYLAENLQTSTKPIYFHFKSMFDLEDAVVERAMERILAYATEPRTGDPWIDSAVGVVMFAIEEKHLWRCINDEKHVPLRRKYGVHVWQTLGEALADYPPFQDLTQNQIEMIRRARWIFIHGLAGLLNNAEWPFSGYEQLVYTVKRISEAFYNEFKDDPEITIGKPLEPDTAPEASSNP